MIDGQPHKTLIENSQELPGGKMFVLELLGPPSLRSDDRSIPVAAQQKRLLGLVAIIALAGKQGL
jgi:hypothetical protein